MQRCCSTIMLYPKIIMHVFLTFYIRLPLWLLCTRRESNSASLTIRSSTTSVSSITRPQTHVWRAINVCGRWKFSRFFLSFFTSYEITSTGSSCKTPRSASYNLYSHSTAQKWNWTQCWKQQWWSLNGSIPFSCSWSPWLYDRVSCDDEWFSFKLLMKVKFILTTL